MEALACLVSLRASRAKGTTAIADQARRSPIYARRQSQYRVCTFCCAYQQSQSCNVQCLPRWPAFISGVFLRCNLALMIRLSPQRPYSSTMSISVRAVVASLRYDEWQPPGVYFFEGRTWVRASTIWSSKRRFCHRASLDDFITQCRGNQRVLLEDWDGVTWMAAA